MKQQSVFKTQPLTAAQQITVNVTGSSFFIDSVDGVVYVKFDDGAELRMISGSYFDCEPGEYFSRITFRSPVTAGGATLTVKYYAGTLKVGNRTPIVYTRNIPTYEVPSVQTILSAASYTVPATNLRTGQPTADNLVRVRLQNLTSSTEPDLKDAGGTKFGTLGAPAGYYSVQTFERNTAIIITNTAGSTIDVGVLAYYALPV